jgi:hypothetical protein
MICTPSDENWNKKPLVAMDYGEGDGKIVLMSYGYFFVSMYRH